jgi:hypothetical protein
MTTTPRVDALSDLVREAFEAWHRSKFGYQTDLCGEERYVSSRAHTLWEAWQASRAAALEEAAATVAAMIISPTDIILCADTIDEAAARIRKLGETR